MPLVCAIEMSVELKYLGWKYTTGSTDANTSLAL